MRPRGILNDMRKRKAVVNVAPVLRDTSGDEALLRELYCKDPCRILPCSLWKAVAKLPSQEAVFLRDGDAVTGVELRQPGKSLLYGTRTRDPLKAASVKLDGVPNVWIHDDFVRPLAPWFERRASFLRMIHRCGDLPFRARMRGLSVRPVEAVVELPLVATFLHACYDVPTPGTDEIAGWTLRPVYDPHLWLWAMNHATGKPVGLAIGEIDRMTGEGSVTWLQVLPEQREQGIGALLLQELVCRLEQKTAFVTASWDVRNPCAPEHLFATCGFTGHDLWWLLQR